MAKRLRLRPDLFLAALFGSAVGYERRSAHRPAGLRTLSLMALGYALFTIISAFGFDTAGRSRVAAQIVTGVGFLGAGTILRSGQRHGSRAGHPVSIRTAQAARVKES